MQTYSTLLGVGIWLLFVLGYITSKKPPKTTTRKEARRNKKIEMYAILDGLDDSVKYKV